MHSEEKALLDAIRVEPLNDLPRLVYADWLEEHGQAERAEFIRVQCRLYDLDPDHPERIDLEEQAWELSVGRDAAWTAELPQIQGVEWDGFERGFPAWAVLGNVDPWPHALGMVEPVAAVLAQTPVRKLRLGLWSGRHLGEVLRLPGIEQLTGLDLEIYDEEGWDFFDEDNLPPASGLTSFSEVVACERLAQLREFAWDGPALITAEEIRAFAHAPHFHNLRHVSFDTNAFEGPAHLHTLGRGSALGELRSFTLIDDGYEFSGDELLEPLSRGANWERLHTLRLEVGDLGSQGIRSLLGSKFPHLRVLELNELGPSEAHHLLEGLPWPLERLHLPYSHLGRDAIRALARSSQLGQLRQLNLEHCGLGIQAAQQLARSQTLRSLRRLDLSGNLLKPKGYLALANAPALEQLIRLELSIEPWEQAHLSAAEMRSFLQMLHLPHLRHLGVENQPVKVRGAKVLAANPSLANLRELVLHNTGVQGSGIEPLLRSPHLQGLRRLDLAENRIGDEIALLADPDCLPQLTEVDLQGNAFGRGIKTKLRQRFGKLNF